jgi:glutathione synthase/RimK-type ligase-like ATP-grasp enzyme
VTASLLLAVDASTPDLTDDDRHFAEACARHGLDPRPLPWGATVPVGSIVVIRSTWDYVERPREFAAWLDHLDAQRAVVHNPTRLLRWNMSKRYLASLAAAGVPTVPTELVEHGAAPSLDSIRARRGWDDVVVKPAVGGTARRSELSAHVGWAALQRHLDALTAEEDAIVQPYLPSVTVTGETSIIAVGGDCRLAVVKRPASNDWRVQTDFGGTVDAIALEDEQLHLAHAALAPVTPVPTYARIDAVRDLDDRLVVLELELVEPELFFRLDPSLGDHLATHLLATAAEVDG